MTAGGVSTCETAGAQSAATIVKTLLFLGLFGGVLLSIRGAFLCSAFLCCLIGCFLAFFRVFLCCRRFLGIAFFSCFLRGCRRALLGFSFAFFLGKTRH